MVQDTALVPEGICGTWSTAPSDIQRSRGKLLDKNGWLEAPDLRCLTGQLGHDTLATERAARADDPRALFSGLQELSYLRDVAGCKPARSFIDSCDQQLYDELQACAKHELVPITDVQLEQLTEALKDAETALHHAWEESADERIALLKARCALCNSTLHSLHRAFSAVARSCSRNAGIGVVTSYVAR